jgi:hypothetical protein
MFASNTTHICEVCREGKYSNNLGKSACDECEIGRFVNSTGNVQCDYCEIGYYSNSTGASLCVACPAGYTTISVGMKQMSDCSICLPGYKKVNTSCFSCDPGTYSIGNVTRTCSSCSVGKSSVANSSACQDCSPGRYSDETGLAACKPCLKGKFSQLTGSTSQEVCQNCSPGKYSNANSSSTCSLCPFGKWSSSHSSNSSMNCLDFPEIEALKCPPGSAFPLVSTGFYRVIAEPDVVYPCVPREACLSSENTTTICAAEYAGFGCNACSFNFFRSSGRCVKCLPEQARWIALVASGLLLMAGISRVFQKYGVISPFVKTVLFWFQFLAILPSLTSVWPARFLSFLNFTSVFNIDIGYLGLSCSFSYSYFTMLGFKILLPLIFSSFAAIEQIVLVVLNRVSKFSWIRVISISLYVTSFFSIQLFSCMFQAFNCIDDGKGNKVITLEPSQRCFSPDWYRFIILDVVFIILYILVLPIALFIFSKKNHDLVVNSLLHPVLNSYKEDRKWFEIIKVLFRLETVLVRDVLTIATGGKLTMTLVLLMIVQWIESKARPYQEVGMTNLSLL